MPFPAPYVRSLIIAGVGGGLVVAAGLTVSAGWMTGNAALLHLMSDWPPMVPLTAATFVLAGAALLAITVAMSRTRVPEHTWRRVAMALAFVVTMIGGLRACHHVMGWPASADMLGFEPGRGPRQMAPLASAGFLLAGVALGLTARRGFYQCAQWLAGGVIFIGWLGISRCFYGGEPAGMLFRMAMHTALLFAVLGMGIFYARPDGGFMVIWNGDTAGGVLVRRLFPAALVVPVLVGWLILKGARADWYGLETGLTLFATTNVTIFAALAWHTASRLHGEDVRRREAERTVRVERDFSDALVDSLPGTFYLYERSGKFLRWNKNFERVTGYDAAEIARMHPLDFFSEEEKAKVAERIDEVFATGKSAVEAGFRAKDGTETPYYFTGVTVMHDGAPCLAGVGIDIAARRRAEEAVRELNADLEKRVARRTTELEAKNRELEMFTYSVSHDLKAPLRGIDGYSRLLLEEHAGQLDDEARRFLGAVRRASTHMGQLIDDLLSYSRLERRTPQPARVRPHALVRSLLSSLAGDIEAHGVRITESIAADVEVCADLQGLTMALRNLLDNALKFTRTTQGAAIEIGARREGGVCVLWVKDNGIGFDMRFVERIFEIFQRLHRAEDYPGTGVGLAIVRKAMERMGGRVRAESAPGQGATFYLEIPLST